MVRVAVIDDLPALVALACAMHAESPQYRDVPFIAGDMEIFLKISMKSPRSLILIAEDAGGPCGMLGASAVPYIFNLAECFSADIGLYVRKDRRGGSIGLRLIDAYEGWARGLNVRRIQLAESTGIDAEKIGELFVKLGYNHSGSSYSKEVQSCV